jgi:hypothetical protein
VSQVSHCPLSCHCPFRDGQVAAVGGRLVSGVTVGQLDRLAVEEAEVSEVDYRQAYEERTEARKRQTEALANLGFAPAFNVNAGMFGSLQLTYCEKCGASIPIVPVDNLTGGHPLDLHKAWHDESAPPLPK